MKTMLSFLLLAGLSLPAGSVLAAADPTRPPAAWLDQPGTAQAGGNADGGLRLQSVLMPQHGKPVAIIGGKTVTVGGRVGEARLVSLTEREAVLQGADGVTRLYLTPDVKKQMIVPPASRSGSRAGHGKDLR
jgi:MSHA biogenesis protein MshK